MTERELVEEAMRQLDHAVDNLKLVTRDADIAHAIIKSESAMRGLDDYMKKHTV